MHRWLEQIGHKPEALDALNVFHVAGTKGKGTTCAFAEQLLRTHGNRTGFPRRTGIAVSPFLVDQTDAIRINGVPITKEKYAEYFFEVWDALPEKHISKRGRQPSPRRGQLNLLVVLHAFIREGVDATVLETLYGGEFDCTNCVDHPSTTVITTIGMDHVRQLGPTIRDIAWHKAGIFKHAVAAFSAKQVPEVADVFRARADERGADFLKFVEDPDNVYVPQGSPHLKPDVQRMNYALAYTAVQHFLKVVSPPPKAPLEFGLLPRDITKAFNTFSWPGRFQRLDRGAADWYLDGAHNDMSIPIAAGWYLTETRASRPDQPSLKCVIFNQSYTKGRELSTLLETLAVSLKEESIDYLIIPEYDDYARWEAVRYKDEEAACQAELKFEALHSIWQRYQTKTRLFRTLSILDAMEKARDLGTDTKPVQVLVTGSLTLVGAAVHYLDQHDFKTSATRSTHD